MTHAGLALLLTTILTAVVHTLIPDHWLPFVLVARAEGWNLRRTAMLTAASALLHVTVSILLAMTVVLAGRGAEMAVTGLSERLAALSGWMVLRYPNAMEKGKRRSTRSRRGSAEAGGASNRERGNRSPHSSLTHW